MIADELLRNPVTRARYQHGRAGALPPDELHPGELYTARLLLGEVAEPAPGIGIYAVDALVKLEDVFADRRLFAVIRYVSEDGQPEDPVYTPGLTEGGIMQGTAAPLPTEEGYLLRSTGSLEDELRELEEQVLVPVRAVVTTAISLERPLPHQLN